MKRVVKTNKDKDEHNLQQVASALLINCMGLRRGESCLVVCDTIRKDLGSAVYKAASQMTDLSRLTLLQPPGPSGWPSDTLATLERDMASRDVILLLTGRSLSHTNARRRAVERGARLASMPGITGDILLRAARPNYHAVREKSERLRDILTSAETVSVSTELGTEITFSAKGMAGHMEDGLYDRPGTWGNVPAGEASIGPKEGTAEGVIVVDWSMSSIGRLEEPLFIRVQEGYAIKVKGKQAEQLLETLRPFGRAAFTMAEFAMGTNEWAQLSGITLEDEKVFGTAHFALGNNISFGGTTDVPIHLDGVLRYPTVIVDGRRIMERGKLLSSR